MCAILRDHPADEGIRKRRRSSGTMSGQNALFSSELKEQLVQAMRHRGQESLNYLRSKYGSDPVDSLCKILKSSPTNGLISSSEDFSCRRQVFGTNEIPQKKPKTFLMLVFDALKDVTLIILMTAAFVSLFLSFYEAEDATSENLQMLDKNSSQPVVPSSGSTGDDMESRANWIEAVAIMGTVLVVALVTALNNYQKERQFRGLQAKIESNQLFTVIRDGALTSVPVKEILVGDVCQLQYGDVIPADGVVVHSNDLKIDESSLTGESELVKKSISVDPVLLSGTQVMEGSGRMIVIAVGLNSQTGVICTLLGITAGSHSGEKRKKTLISCWKSVTRFFKCTAKEEQHGSSEDNGDKLENGKNPVQAPASSLDLGRSKSPLQIKLAKLSIRIGYIGVVAALLTSLVLAARFSFDTFLIRGQPWSNRYIQVFVRFIILGVTVIVVSVPEGLPLAVTLALAYSVRQMMRDNNLVRHLDACETMGNATAICSDKTGTLTTNKMSVVDAYIVGKRVGKKIDSKIDEKVLPGHILNMIADAICVNTAKTSIVEPNYAGGLPNYLGNRTECALLSFVLRIAEPQQGRENPISVIRARFPEQSIVKIFTFNSRRKSMSTAVCLPDGRTRLFVKGASEVLLEKCKYIMNEKGADPIPFSAEDRAEINRTVIQPMACDGLRTVCVAFRDFTKDE